MIRLSINVILLTVFTAVYVSAGEKFTNSIGQEFVYIKPGTFMMGSPPDEPGRFSDEKQHKVTITRGFYMQTTEVTQWQWKTIMGTNPSSFQYDDNYPVDSVAWNGVQKFIKKLNQMAKDNKYRLPTEAEWEYVCRAGSTTSFSSGKCLSTDQANYDGYHPLAGCQRENTDHKQSLLQASCPMPGAFTTCTAMSMSGARTVAIGKIK